MGDNRLVAAALFNSVVVVVANRVDEPTVVVPKVLLFAADGLRTLALFLCYELLLIDLLVFRLGVVRAD